MPDLTKPGVLGLVSQSAALGPRGDCRELVEGLCAFYRALFCADPLVPEKGEVHTVVSPGMSVEEDPAPPFSIRVNFFCGILSLFVQWEFRA